MRVLVTGSSGFVGGWMGRQLRAAGDELIDWPDEIDLRDPAAVERKVQSAAPDAVCHLAAQA
ncbi:MAG TPA: NAD-dependent epimerase/dehydratase family protein, partial [Acidimicrobiales bacterium]|nr:NAD-dependent epimerase/dehydratase family protein [Acidimicrobiales bacterium]